MVIIDLAIEENKMEDLRNYFFWCNKVYKALKIFLNIVVDIGSLK